MRAVKRIRNGLRGRLKNLAPAWLKRRIWNWEFAEGCWDFVYDTPDDCIYSYVAKYVCKGRLLDLGCGTGNTATELDEESFEAYVGVDISDVAIEIARRRVEGQRMAKTLFVQSDLVSYQPSGLFDAILFRESLWYIPQDRMKQVLDKYRKHLKNGGVFIVRMYDRCKLASWVEQLRDSFEVVEEYVPETSKDIVLVLR